MTTEAPVGPVDGVAENGDVLTVEDVRRLLAEAGNFVVGEKRLPNDA